MQKPVYRYSIIVCVLSVASRFPQLLKYGSVLPCSTLLTMLLCFASYEQCSARLLKMLHKRCNTDMLGVLLIYPHSPLGTARPWDRAYISVKPLAAVLQPIYVALSKVFLLFRDSFYCDLSSLTNWAQLRYISV